MTRTGVIIFFLACFHIIFCIRKNNHFDVASSCNMFLSQIQLSTVSSPKVLSWFIPSYPLITTCLNLRFSPPHHRLILCWIVFVGEQQDLRTQTLSVVRKWKHLYSLHHDVVILCGVVQWPRMMMVMMMRILMTGCVEFRRGDPRGNESVNRLPHNPFSSRLSWD